METRLVELKEYLSQLRQGETVVLSKIENQYGEEIESSSLSFCDGEWQLTELNCYSSKWAGMGSCNCVSHNPYEATVIPRRQALAELRLLIEKGRKGASSKEAEIAWMDKTIPVALYG